MENLYIKVFDYLIVPVISISLFYLVDRWLKNVS